MKLRKTHITIVQDIQESNSILKLDKYKLFKDKMLGKGASSSVYLTRDQHDQLYATKILPKSKKQNVLAAKKQTLILASVKHPQLPRLIQTYESDNNFFIVTSYHQGKTLRQCINQWKNQHHKRPFLLDLIKIIVKIIDALQYLLKTHSIVHRDIKPQNIIYNQKGEVILIDFGLANLYVKDPNHKDKEYVGTAQYMAPQLLNKEALNHNKSDIWSLGVLVYELISYGKYPWSAESQQILYENIMNIKLELPQGCICPPIINNLIRGCLKLNPQNRWDWQKLFEYQRKIKQQCLSLSPSNPCQCSFLSYITAKVKL